MKKTQYYHDNILHTSCGREDFGISFTGVVFSDR